MDGAISDLLQPSPVFLAIILAVLAGVLVRYYKFKRNSSNAKFPPGWLGLPFVGETLSFLGTLKQDKTREWVETRIARYGPIFKTSLMGKPTVVITGSSGNRFVFTAKDIARSQANSVRSILGENSLFGLTGITHKLMRGAMVSFLKPESLQKYVGDMDSILKEQIFKEFNGNDSVTIVPFMRRITFNVTCAILFALPPGKIQEQLFEDFKDALKGFWTLPLNFPGTRFHRAMAARKRIYDYFLTLMEERRKKLFGGEGNNENDVVSEFIRHKNENNEIISEEMLIDNLLTIMVASYDTSSILLTHLVRHLARDTNVYERIREEQDRVRQEKKGTDEKLTWHDIQKMKYTWCACQEIMRITPPVFGSFRRATADTSFGGFDIPKGWQVFWISSGTHMDESIFPEPEKVDPSRFEAAAKNIPPYSYIPFGAGSRICPGSDFAKIEVLVVIHYLVTNYEWAEMIPNEPITRNPMPVPAMGLPIKLHKRKYHEDICS